MKGLTPWIVVALIVVGCALPGMRRTRIQPAPHSRAREVTMEVTGYCKCKACCGWERTWYGRPVFASGRLRGMPKKVGMTASGTMARKGTIAADGARYPFGTVMEIPGYGRGVVEDRGGAITGNRIDLYFRTHGQALAWGRKQVVVTVWESAR